MKTDQRLLPWIYHLLRKSHVEYLTQRSQIESMLEEGALLAPLFFEKDGSTSEAESFQACSADDSDAPKAQGGNNGEPDKFIEW